MIMGERDETYEKRKENSNSKKVGKGDSTKYEVSKNIDEEVIEVEPDSAPCENDDDGKDPDFISNKVTGKERTILVELPRDIMNNNEVCSMLPCNCYYKHKCCRNCFLHFKVWQD